MNAAVATWPRGRWTPKRSRRAQRMCRGDGLIGRELRACLRLAQPLCDGYCRYHHRCILAVRQKERVFEV